MSTQRDESHFQPSREGALAWAHTVPIIAPERPQAFQRMSQPAGPGTTVADTSSLFCPFQLWEVLILGHSSLNIGSVLLELDCSHRSMFFVITLISEALFFFKKKNLNWAKLVTVDKVSHCKSPFWFCTFPDSSIVLKTADSQWLHSMYLSWLWNCSALVPSLGLSIEKKKL